MVASDTRPVRIIRPGWMGEEVLVVEEEEEEDTAEDKSRAFLTFSKL